MAWRWLSEDDLKQMSADRLGRIADDIETWLPMAKSAVANAETLLGLVQMHRKAKSGSRED